MYLFSEDARLPDDDMMGDGLPERLPGTDDPFPNCDYCKQPIVCYSTCEMSELMVVVVANKTLQKMSTMCW